MLKVTPDEWREAVDRDKSARMAAKVAPFLKDVYEVINDFRETVALPDEGLVIDEVCEKLHEDGFHLVRIGDRDEDGKVLMRILAL